MSSRRGTTEKIECQFCHKLVSPQGMGSHQRGQPCRDARARSEQGPEFDDVHSPDSHLFGDLVQRERDTGVAALLSATNEDLGNIVYPGRVDSVSEVAGDVDNFNDDNDDNEAVPAGSVPPINNSEASPDDIKIEYHPSSGKPPEVFSFINYCGMETPPKPSDDGLSSLDMIDERPWRPFATRLDFEFAEVFLDSHMNNRQIETTIALIREAKADPKLFTLTGVTDLSRIWEQARVMRSTGFTKHTLTVEYKDEELEYDVWIRPLWHWCQELLLNTAFIDEFRWDAERLYKYVGGRFERFIDEPWTADAWWNYQTTLPNTAKPFVIILYADKTRLSSFGTEKGYPVLARCANLPVGLRNGTGVGGGRLVGWLPIPEDIAGEKGKRRFVNLKREIWHEAVGKIVSSIEQYTELGTALTCADGVNRQIFPHILMLSADYEEQTMMALTRGATGLFPCPICLVPKESIPNLSVTFPERTTETMQRVWTDSQALNITDREELLKQYSLRDIQNIFWSLRGVDIYQALSWDRLHAYHGGLFSDHLLGELKAIVKALKGRSVDTGIDLGLQAIPPWSGLNHFTSLSSSGEFADGTKHEDLSKVIIFASVHVITQQNSPDGYLLLQLIRSYLELDMCASLTVHNERTLAAGQEELKRFEELLQQYQLIQKTEKSWTFPKAHTHQHMFRDIQLKGVTRNYNTKPNEKANGPLKKYYQRHTNFKNVAPQVLRISEMDLVATMIRTAIDVLDEALQSRALSAQEVDSGPDAALRGTVKATPSPGGAPRVFHGSVCPVIALGDVESEHKDDAVFENFRRKVNKYFTDRNANRRVVVPAETLVTPYRFVKLIFTSVIDWRWNTHILRAYPSFHGKPRYDYALVKISNDLKQCIIVQILYIFGISYNSTTHNLALVLPFDVPRMPVHRARDADLRLTRVCPRRRSSAVIIETNSIIRGVLLVEDRASTAGEHLLVEVVDEDMWARMKSVELLTNVVL